MYNYRMKIQYDGTRYSGWQHQGNTDATIQDRIEKGISCVLREKIEVHGSGRTDAGVHALGQTANFHTAQKLEEKSFLERVNGALPEDIAVLSLEQVPDRFHARLWAVEKTYRYTVNTSCVPDVFRRRYEYQLKEPLNLDRMRQASELLLGTHDFQGFSTGHTKKSTVRTISEIRFEQEGAKLRIYYTGDGFLYNMVRILTGTLLEIGMGKREISTIPEIFSGAKREQAGFTAPAKGLCLMEVRYKGESEA